MQDNDFLQQSHRPVLPSFAACFESIFRLHSETGNIWSQLLGCVVFLIIAVYFQTRPRNEIKWEEKFVYLPFFIGAIGCMLLSFLFFYTFCCYSISMNNYSSNYVGILLMINGSAIPWCYYAFYCHPKKRIFYIASLSLISCMYLSMNDKFMSINFRTYCAAFFVTSGCMAAIPAVHLTCIHGFRIVFYQYSIAWIILTSLTYIVGAVVYACRIPRTIFSWLFQYMVSFTSNFHICVILATFILYHGISILAKRKMTNHCEDHDGFLLLNC